MATITGFIEKIKFRNEENGYTVLSVTDQSDGDEVIMVGTLSYAAEGDMIQASGRMIEHPVYGEQLQIESYEMKTPQDAESMERYLGSGAIKGIGAALAARIVRHFKAHHLDFSVRIEFLSDTPTDGVQLHSIEIAVSHGVREHPEKVTDTHCRFQNISCFIMIVELSIL